MKRSGVLSDRRSKVAGDGTDEAARLKRSSIRSLRPGEPDPEGEPRLYKNAGGYTRARWKVGTAEYVERYLREPDGTLSRDRPGARTLDPERVVNLYQSGLSTTSVAREVGCTPGAVSRLLARRGVPIRAKADYLPPVDIEKARELYLGGMGVEDVARAVDVTPQRLLKLLRQAGVTIRRQGRPKGKPSKAATYQTEFLHQRPAVIARADGACEARIDGICSGPATHVHHRLTRGQGGDNSMENLCALCFQCHRYIHNHPEWSYANGWLRPMVASHHALR